MTVEHGPITPLEAHWRAILDAHARTVCELDRQLGHYGLGASDFEVLSVLAGGLGEHGNANFRVQAVAQQVHLSQSALSRVIGRLEKADLVTRAVCQEDRRGVWVTLTPRGHSLHAEVRPLALAVLSRTLGTVPAADSCPPGTS